MSMQRRRGDAITIHIADQGVDNRGNHMFIPRIGGDTFTTRGWEYADRSARAEIPGQMGINVIRVGMVIPPAYALRMNLFARVYWQDSWWDIVAPPAYHRGTRQTKHVTLTMRERPDDGGIISG